MGGVDSDFFLEPAELRSLVEAANAARLAVQPPRFGPHAGEPDTARVRRSLYIVEDVRSIWLSGGLATGLIDTVVGRRFPPRRAPPHPSDLV